MSPSGHLALSGPNRWKIGEVVHRTERGDQLRGEDREMARSWRRVFDDERPTGQPGVRPDRRFGWEHGGAEDLIPDRQCEAEVDVLWSVELVVDPVIVRADEDPLEGPKPSRVFECAKATIAA